MKVDKQKIQKLLTESGIQEIIGRKELEKKLLLGKKLIVKFGADPTRPDLHLGHAVALRKMREFQDLGHKVVFLIGDATSKIGDPTEKDKTRPMMTDKEIKKNAATYVKQASKILKTDKNLLEIKYNSQWFSKMSFYEFLRLMTMTTAARVLERDMFEERMKSGRDIGLHELVYPIMQGYDSVELKADAVLLGSDQKFNELFGRHYQQKFGQDPQAMVIMKILVGTDGKEKMSKSLDNYVGITESADQIYGKIMSIPDGAMKEYFELATDLDFKKIKEKNPRDTKMKLAFEIAKTYHGEKLARKTQENFVNIFQKKKTPTKVISVSVSDKIGISEGVKIVKEYSILDYIIKTGFASSRNDARRKIIQGGVRIGEQKITDPNYRITKDDNNKVLKVGKLKFAKIKFQ